MRIRAKILGLVVLLLLGTWVQGASARTDPHSVRQHVEAEGARMPALRLLDSGHTGGGHRCDCSAVARGARLVTGGPKPLIALPDPDYTDLPGSSRAGLLRVVGERNKSLSFAALPPRGPAFLLTSRLLL